MKSAPNQTDFRKLLVVEPTNTVNCDKNFIIILIRIEKTRHKNSVGQNVYGTVCFDTGTITEAFVFGKEIFR